MVSDTEIVQLVDNAEQHWGRPFTTATDVAEHVDMSRQAIHRRLDNLHDDGQIRKYKPGRGVIWWTDDDRQRAGGD
jgi:DNA-binding Lrp family transcriptional regulator